MLTNTASSHTSQAASRKLLVYLLITAALFLVGWSLAVPIYEAPDEPHHWAYARYVHDHKRLPLYTSQLIEANQPPLYYFLIAPFAVASEPPPYIAWIDSQGRWLSQAPPRLFADTDLRKYRPFRVTRLATALLSLAVVFFCYMAGLEATGQPRAGLLTGSLVAFLPQFTFRGTNISNDAMLALASAAATYVLIRLIKRGFTWRIGLIAGALTGITFLSKVNGACMAVLLTLAVLSEAVPWKLRLRYLAFVVGIALITVAPWCIRNQQLYGDPIASKAIERVIAFDVFRKPITSPYFITTFPYMLTRSFIGVFGWMNVWLPERLYKLFAASGLIAIFGLAWVWITRYESRRLTALLATVPLANLILTIQFNLRFTQPQGRYMFASLCALAVLVCMGLQGLPGWRPGLVYPVVVLLAVVNSAILYAVIVPAYWRKLDQPRQVSEVRGNLPVTQSICRVELMPCLQNCS